MWQYGLLTKNYIKKEMFNEKKLREEIAKTWGEHGAHIEVYDMLVKKANAVLPQADVIKSVCENCGEDTKERKENIGVEPQMPTQM